MDKPQTPGSIRKVLGEDGYDDGGVGDLRLAIDLEDYVLRRKRGENAYFQALKNDLIPRIKEGNWKRMTRKEQKIELAKMLFHEEGDEEIIQDPYKSVEVYSERVEELDTATKNKFTTLLRSAKYALQCALVLREPACVALCLSKVCERYLQLYGKEGAEDAVRCGKKAIAICLEDFYDIDDVAIEVGSDELASYWMHVETVNSRLLEREFCSHVLPCFLYPVTGRRQANARKARKGPDLPRTQQPWMEGVHTASCGFHLFAIGLPAHWKRLGCHGQGR